MKTITLSDKIYADILRLKNMLSMSAGTNHITNLKVCKQLRIPDEGIWLMEEKLFGNIMWEEDFEPEFTFDKFFKRLSDTVWEEQENEDYIPFELWR